MELPLQSLSVGKTDVSRFTLGQQQPIGKVEK